MLKTILRYLSIWQALFRASLVADLEYRTNIAIKIFTDFLWYFAQMLTFGVLYKHTDTLGGWDFHQLTVFMILLFFVDALYMTLFSENMDQMPAKVVRGELDLLLAKPVDAQFMLSTQKLNTAYCVNLIFIVIAFCWALTQLDGGVPWSRLPLLLVGIPAGLAVMYSSKLFFSASSIYYGNVSNLMMLWFQFYRLGTRPDVFYPSWLRYVVLGIIPMGFIASVPARMLVAPLDWWLPVNAVLIACFSMAAARWYWNCAIRRYASASS
jgi:ABC-2 type transport system permease protein